ncbi:MAG: PhoX family phosphatase [Hyphomonadaceae bacterium]
MAKHIGELIATRRALLGGLAGLPLLSLADAQAQTPAAGVRFASVAATNADTVSLPPGYSWRTLIAWGDPLFENVAPFDANTLTRADQELRFGQNNDMLAMFPATYAFPPERDQARMLMCANHEYYDPSLMFPALTAPTQFTPAHIETGLAASGISVTMLERGPEGWRPVRDASPGAGFNRRITPFTPVVFAGPAANHPRIAAAAAFVNAREPGAPAGAVSCGTLANCAGGQTPWGTYLSAEENFHSWFGATDDAAPALREALTDPAIVLDNGNFGLPGAGPLTRLLPAQFDLTHNPHGPALYGWTVEVDPYDPTWAPRKRTALGRRKAECATTALARDGRVVVYSGDDQINEFLYKFVSRDRFDAADRLANRDLLDHGQLYVARFDEDGAGVWMPITLRAANAAAREAGYTARFRDEGDLMLRAREAARLMGATPMDRPEDVEAVLDENWVGQGPVLVVCTNNRDQGFEAPGRPRRESPTPNRAQANPAGHILRLDETANDCGALTFRWDVFVMAGDPNTAQPIVTTRAGLPAHVSTRHAGVQTLSGDRFACPDNLCIDTQRNVWISTDGSDAVFADCNDTIMVAPADASGPKPVKRFLVGPVGAEICGPTMAPDERAFFAAIQHPGESDASGAEIFELRWTRGQRPPSNFPDGGEAWPRSAVVVITRDDGGRIGD